MKVLFFLLVLFYGWVGWSQDVFEASRSGNINRIKELYFINKDTINAKNDYSFTPLIIATYRNNKNCVKFLLKHHADVTYNSDEGTALLGACYKGSFSIAKLLIKNKSDVNAIGPNNISPLIFAVQSKNKELVEYLLSKGADTTIKDSAGRTAYDYVKLMNLNDLKDLFLEN